MQSDIVHCSKVIGGHCGHKWRVNPRFILKTRADKGEILTTSRRKPTAPMGGVPEPVTGADKRLNLPARFVREHQGPPQVALCFSGPASDMLYAVVWLGRAPGARQPYRSTALATPNYSYEKRQRELAKKRKNEEKKQKKQVREPGDAGGDDQPSTENGHDNPPPAPAVD